MAQSVRVRNKATGLIYDIPVSTWEKSDASVKGKYVVLSVPKKEEVKEELKEFKKPKKQTNKP